MRLYLMRHATAAPHAVDDPKRPLTPEGRLEAEAVAKGLIRLEVVPELILTSPYLRAAQTAEIVARAFKPHVPRRELKELQSDASPAAASKALAPHGDAAALLCVGHEPHLSEWIAELVAGPGGLRCQMKKAGVACIELERVPPPAGSGRLRWLMGPKQLALVGRSRR